MRTHLLPLALAALLLLTPVARAAEAIDPALRERLRLAAAETDSFRDRFDGEVWLTDMSARLRPTVADDDFRIALLRNVHYEAARAMVEPELVLSVIHVESNFNPWAISRVGARGLMQVMPFWLKEIGRPGDNLFQPQTNLRYGCTILRYYLDKENGNQVRALMRYNGTRERKYPAQVFRLLQTKWHPQ